MKSEDILEPEVDEVQELRENLEKLQKTFSNQEDKLRNMANKLEEHLREPDAHNPGVMRKK